MPRTPVTLPTDPLPGEMLHIPPPMPDGPVLVCRTDAIGDLVLTTPLLRALCETWPGLEVDVLVSRRAAPVLEGFGGLRRVLVDPGGLARRARLLREGRYRWALAARPEPGLALALALAGIPRRIGTGRRAWSFLFTHRLSFPRKHGGRHEAEYNTALAAPLGWRGRAPWAEIAVHEENRAAAQRLLHRAGADPEAPYAVVHPGSRGSAPNLPYATWRALLEGLAPEIPVVLTGTGEELHPLSPLPLVWSTTESGARRPRILSLAGKTDLRSLIGLLAGARVVVASSTGPLHLAAAAGAPVVAPYGLRPAVSATRWRPWVDPERVTLLEPAPGTCPERCDGRCGREGCLASIPPEELLAAALRWVHDEPAGETARNDGRNLDER